ncbi:alpha/beta hydrolase, partial [Sanguibacter sp. 25GB23B1]
TKDGGLADDTFEVSAEPETFLVPERFEGTNVSRAVALAPLLGHDGAACVGLDAELQALGFAARIVERPDRWGGDGTDSGWPETLRAPSEDRELRERCMSRWQELNERPSRHAARAFALSMLDSPRERESTAAAATLWGEVDGSAPPGGDPAADAPPPGLEHQVRRRLDLASRSTDAVVRSFAGAADVLVRQRGVSARGAAAVPPVVPGVEEPGTNVATMVHGTWGWDGRWWRPGGDFHTFVARRVRPGLYGGGARYGWSGSPSGDQRRLAAQDLADWTAEIAPGGLRTLFAHSYGGEVAARARLAGTPVEELVLLSSPATTEVVAAAAAGRTVDVRLRFDPVLALARTPQRLPAAPTVVEVLLAAWRLDHGATHDPRVWESENVLERTGLLVERGGRSGGAGQQAVAAHG